MTADLLRSIKEILIMSISDGAGETCSWFCKAANMHANTHANMKNK